MAGQTVAPPDDWADDDWVDVSPVASHDTPQDAALNDKFAAWLRSQGADEETVARGLELSRAHNAGALNAATQGSMLGGTFGGNVGSGVGAAAGTLVDGGSLEDAAVSGAKNFALSKATGAVINKAMPWASGLLQRGGARAMKGAVKPDRGYLEKMAGAKQGGISKMEDQIVQTALDEDINPVRRSGMDKLQGRIEATAAQRDAAIDAAPNVPVPGSANRARAAGRRSLRVMSRGDAPQEDIAVVQKFLGDLESSPRTSVDVGGTRQLRDLTPRELAETVEAGNDRMRGLFNGQSKNAEVQSRLRVQRARTRSLDDAAGTKDLSQRMKRLIDLRNVGNIATRRAASNNPISLTDVISLSAGRPGVLAGSIGMKAPVLGDIALALNRTGKSMAGGPSAGFEQLRRAVLALALNQQSNEQ